MPSSSRTLWVTFDAMNSDTSAGKKAVAVGFELEHVAAQSDVGALELYLHSPFEPAKQACFETFHFARCAVARHDNLPVVLVEVVEDVEEGILCTRHILQILNIIDYKSVDALVEMEEIVDILCSGSCILALEKSGGYI